MPRPVRNVVKATHASTQFGVRRGRNPFSAESMANRMDGAVDAWKRAWTRTQRALLPPCISPRHLDYFGPHDFLPGRQPVREELDGHFQNRTQVQIGMLVAQGWLPENLTYILGHGLQIVRQHGLEHQLPFLAVDAGYQQVLRAAFDEEELDLHQREKEIVKVLLRPVIERSQGDLAQALELATRSSIFGGSETHDIGNDPARFEHHWSQPMTYYTDHRAQALEHLQTPSSLRIAYILDNAGEAFFDLLVVKTLLEMGHVISLVARSKPAINDETISEIRAELIRQRFTPSNLTTLAGWDLLGINLLATPPKVEEALTAADVVISKGEGNFEGLPPDHDYSFDVLYLLRSKTSGLDHRVDQTTPPEQNQGIVLFKPASLEMARTVPAPA